jgi:hypothetical protein
LQKSLNKTAFLLFYNNMNPSRQEKTTSRVVIAIVIALGLLGAVAVTITIMTIQQAEAGCERGNAGSHAINQSKGRCFDRGTF